MSLAARGFRLLRYPCDASTLPSSPTPRCPPSRLRGYRDWVDVPLVLL